MMLRALLILALTAAAAPCQAQENPCDGFSWNVSHERALFAGTTTPSSAGSTSQTAPLLASDTLHVLQLGLRSQVRFLAPPGRSRPGDGFYAGLARLHVAQSGVYRISLDQPAWIDVIDEGQPIAASDFQGRSGCNAPHKIVQFLLPSARELLLQLSGAPDLHLKLTVTRIDAAP